MKQATGRSTVRKARRAVAITFVATGATVVALASSSCSHPASSAPKRCAGNLAIGSMDVFGGSLPDKTLALTFDDGPGVRTRELSHYLKEQGIRATFFVNGMHLASDGGVADAASILASLSDDGHLVANHTQTHTSLTGRSTGSPHLSDARTVAELAETDALIAPFVPDGRFVFRAPYGDYDEASYAALQASPMKKYVGPINWDIGDHMGPAQATDWDCWQRGPDGIIVSVKRCGELYLDEIKARGRGIVLMHDPYFIGDDPHKGGTVDMVEAIVPTLKAQGYAFVRVDEVPAIADAFPPPPPRDAGNEAGDAGDMTAYDSGSHPANVPGAPEPGSSGTSERDAGGNTEPCPPSPQATTNAQTP